MLPVFSQAQNPIFDSVRSELKTIAEGFRGRYHSPSIVLVVVHKEDILFSEALGYADIDNKIPATIDSKYPILSVTKTFTATMLMQLVEKGTVSLDDDASKYMPELNKPDGTSVIGKTSLLQLATHTSGLPRNTQADISFTKDVDRWMMGDSNIKSIALSSQKEFLNSLKYLESEYTKYQLRRYSDRLYSNLGYSLLGTALERTSKTDCTTYITNNICKPLGMQDTGFLDATQDYGHMAKGYRYSEILKDHIATPVFIPNSGMYAGGMYSTARDLAKFISFQFRENPDEDILSTDNRAMMRAFNIAWKPSYPFVLHEGAMLGYRCEIVFNPELEIGWVVLTNTTDFEFSRMNEMLSQLLTPLFNLSLIHI